MAAYKRKIYLINPNFQLRFSLYVCLFLFISSLIYPVTIYNLVTELALKVSTVSPEITAQVTERKKDLIIFLSLWQLGFTVMIFVVCIFISHKIAGPIYKLRKYLQAIKNNNPQGRLFFRNGDYFPEVAEDFNEAFEHIQENYKKDFVYLSEVNTYLNNLSLVVPDDKKVVISEINKKLSEIQDRFNGI